MGLERYQPVLAGGNGGIRPIKKSPSVLPVAILVVVTAAAGAAIAYLSGCITTLPVTLRAAMSFNAMAVSANA